MSDSFRVKRARSPEELVGPIRALEPATSHILSAVRDRRLGRGQRGWLVEGSDGVAAVLLVDRLCFDRWRAWPVLLDRRAAPALAPLIDRSPAWLLEGRAADVAECEPHLSRRRGYVERAPFFQGSLFVDVATPDAVDRRTRVAEPADLESLVELYRGWELAIIPTVPRLRRYLRHHIDHGPIVILEEHGRIRAAGYVGSRTERFLVWTGLTVHPDARGRGLGLALFPLGALLTKEEGCQGAAVWSETNEIRVKPRRVERYVGHHAVDEWATLALGPPWKRVRGQARARGLLERLEGPTVRRRMS